MAYLYLLIGLLVQGSLVTSNVDEPVLPEAEEVAHDESKVTKSILVEPIEFDNDMKDDFFKMMFSSTSFYPTPALTMMTQINDSEMTPEEQVENIKTIAKKMGDAVQNDLVNLLSYSLECVNKNKLKHQEVKYENVTESNNDEISEILEHDMDNTERKKRSVETPMDSTKLVMRLLNHIKNTNEFQNMAIEKMMSAQEIADKFGIEFNPDPEILVDLAIAANEQTQNLTDILSDACESQNSSLEVSFVPIEEEMETMQSISNPNDYFRYSVDEPEDNDSIEPQNTVNTYDFAPEQVRRPVNEHQHHHHHHHHQQPQKIETQMMAPPAYTHSKSCYPNPPVTQRPAFYEPLPAYTPAPEYYPQFCSEYDPVTTAIVVEEITLEPEPEMVAEEIEETVTSKFLIEHEEPGVATVNHIMTHTVSEKAHFRTPQIESLPEQMHYYFFL